MIAGTAINVIGVFLLHFGVMTATVINIASLVAGGVNTMIPIVAEQTDVMRDTKL